MNNCLKCRRKCHCISGGIKNSIDFNEYNFKDNVVKIPEDKRNYYNKYKVYLNKGEYYICGG